MTRLCGHACVPGDEVSFTTRSAFLVWTRFPDSRQKFPDLVINIVQICCHLYSSPPGIVRALTRPRRRRPTDSSPGAGLQCRVQNAYSPDGRLRPLDLFFGTRCEMYVLYCPSPSHSINLSFYCCNPSLSLKLLPPGFNVSTRSVLTRRGQKSRKISG